jgi:hypothetical protein|uniref:Uncharacterized protein n=1 Tax=viral metagenome TaxID=1070528 RepID=A0A6C0DM97_9ZZZZ
MKSIAIFILFVGAILIIKSYYELKYSKINAPATVVKYIPISQYEETLSANEQLNEFYKSLFESTQPHIYDAKKI